MSFHGSPGTGKNYIAEHIARALYKKSANSKFVHKYRGRVDFPLESHVEQYRIKLVTDIQNAISKCPKSLFIFDEILEKRYSFSSPILVDQRLQKC
ncbi:torsin-like protein [Anopheles nili]|uniref:torsin-like protein n=1 Tax=Anopheles nili TaxID=185578 RepID=UPI00237BB9AF|nr:torsin-like protein [Anopheles nili]